MKIQPHTISTLKEAARMGIFLETALSEEDAIASQVPPGAFTFKEVSKAHRKVHAMANAPGHVPTDADMLRIRVLDVVVARMIVDGDDYLEQEAMDEGTIALVTHFQ